MDTRLGDLLDYVWIHLAGIYGHRFTSTAGENPRGPGGRMWGAALRDMSREQIDRGIAACMAAPADEWPTLLLFRDRCLGLPPLRRVMSELNHLESASAFTLKVRFFLDLFAWRSATERQRTDMLQEPYALAREAVMRGEPLPNPGTWLADESSIVVQRARVPATRAEREAKLVALRDANRDLL